jgi:hypothetical protein
MMILPEDLQNQFEHQLESYQEERKMPVLSRMELRGLEKAEQRGTLLTARVWLIEVLETRFENVSQTIKEAVNQIEDVARLKQLHKQAITVASLIEFEQLLG